MRVGAAVGFGASQRRRTAGLLAACWLGATLGGPRALAEAPTSPRPKENQQPAPDQGADSDPQARKRARNHFEQGQEAYRKGKWEEARALFQAADALMPSPELAFNLALVCERSGRAAQAVRYYGRYLKTAKVDKREARELRKKIAALATLAARQRGQLKLPPPSGDQLTAEARRFFDRGLSLYKRSQREAAMAAFTAAYRLRETPELLFNLALISEELGRKQDAIDYYRAYLRRLPSARDATEVRSRIDTLGARDP